MSVLFKAKTTEAYHIKILVELLSNNIKTGCFEIYSTGIRLNMTDAHRRLLIVLNLLSENFTEYRFNDSENVKFIGLNMGHFHKMLKSIKKKDSLELYIEEADPTELCIKVIPKENNRVTTSSVKIQTIQNIEFNIPQTGNKPVLVASSEFQKMIKDMNSISNTNTITVCSKGFHIEFKIDAGGILKRKVEFGELEKSDENCSEYTGTFMSNQLSRLTKIAGLAPHIKIFPGSPLSFRANVGSLGEISIFLKSKEELDKESYTVANEDSDSE